MRSLRYAPEIRWLLQVAMLVFIVTVAIGVLNGTKIVGTLDRATLLTHVHSGTLGWITLGVVAACLWLFGGTAPRAGSETLPRAIAVVTALAVPVYIAAFFSGNSYARAIFGFPVLAGIVLLLGWLVVEARRIGWRRLSVPQLSAIAGITTLIVGSTLGVYVQLALASGEAFRASDAIGGHVSAQVVGYLVLMGMALIEWRARPDGGALSPAGAIQVALLFGGGLLIATSFLLGQQQLAGPAVLLELVALPIFIVRVGWRAMRQSWTALGSGRHVAVAVPFLVFNIGTIIYLIVALFVLRIYKDFADVPMALAVTLDHAMFVGAMTNLIFAMLYELTADRRAILPWADHVIFWGMNAGVAAFIVVLLANITALERVTAPVMGASILLAILTYTLRLRAPMPVAAPARA